MTELRLPVIVVNFKVYSEVEGPGATALARAIESAAKETGASFVACPPMVELSKVAGSVAVPVFAQHVDDKKPGSITGYVSPQSARAAGAQGTLLNHAEHRIPVAEISALIESCRKLGMVSIVCSDTAESSAALAALNPDFIAVEPPELIGGDVSVTTADPQIVSRTVRMVREVNASVKVLCGAGVKNGRDVKAALDLGAEGVLLASGVVKAKDVRAALLDLVSF
ncbi:MAG: Triosephosphate isomerase [Methanomassiliicoccales archaeon PtaB.Bin134]|nr:MAG: Triosephosphate isomerase [Methanomassiliicoccales archaeon PtaB.Bin134]